VLAVIAAGGMLGVAARYGVGRAIPRVHGAFPWATLWINISGSFVLGVFIVIVVERLGPTWYLRPFFGTGFLGSFTTFSTFSVETDLLIKDGHVTTAAAYVASTLVVGLLSAWLGICIGRLLAGRVCRVGGESTGR
jgi:fluoride exporter